MRTVLSILFVFSNIPLLVYRLRRNIFVYENGFFPAASLAVISICMLTIATFITMAFFKFKGLVSRIPFKTDLNHCFILVEILSILAQTASLIGVGILLLVQYEDIYEFEHVQTMFVLQFIAMNAIVISYAIMWIIFYKSMKMASLRHKQA